MEAKYQEAASKYDREEALWSNKNQFLEQQKDQAKQDLQEATRKFEMTLEQLQKRGSADRDKIENTQNSIMSTMESKFKQQIKDS